MVVGTQGGGVDEGDWPNPEIGFPEEQVGNGVPLFGFVFWSWIRKRRIRRRVSQCPQPRIDAEPDPLTAERAAFAALRERLQENQAHDESPSPS